jgi:hypothetical protein
VLIVEWIEAGYWKNKSLVVRENVEVGRLMNSKVFKK